MCLAAWSIAQNARFPCVIATNRDEFFDRPAAPLSWWMPDGEPQTPILGGRDLAAGGTWLGVSGTGGFALVTNLREPDHFDPALPSRGDLVQQALAIDAADDAALAALAAVPRNGFNLLRLDLQGRGGVWVGNHPTRLQRFGAGVHGLSNAKLDTPWPKLRRLSAALAQAVNDADDEQALVDRCFEALMDPTPAADADLPDTGIGLERERLLSPAFIRMPPAATGGRAAYGTRCSTLVVVHSDGGNEAMRWAAPAGSRATVIERRYGASGMAEAESSMTVWLPAPGVEARHPASTTCRDIAPDKPARSTA